MVSKPRMGGLYTSGQVAKVPRREVKGLVACELWARAAGRCEFCNEPLYRSPVTQEPVNMAEKAHIYSFAKGGPRGRGPHAQRPKALNEVGNLILLCRGCHRTVDVGNQGFGYPAELLLQAKRRHEQRVYIVTGISPNRKSNVVLYSANIGEERPCLDHVSAAEAMLPDWYPAEETPISLSMTCEHEDRTRGYWVTEARNLRVSYERYVVPAIRRGDPAHFSLFALAPQPLLVLLGSLFTDKVGVEVYQPHREPRTWEWQSHPDGFEFVVRAPRDTSHPPVLVISVSYKVSRRRITSVLGDDVSIWEFSATDCHNDCMRSRAQLSMFRTKMRKLIARIAEKHGQSIPLSIFPCMPASCAVELGRVRMPKADMPWIVYDQNNKAGKFIKAVCIRGRKHG